MGVGKYNSTEPVISIPVREFQRLSDDSRFLAALMAAGVDSWDGYNVAQEIVDEDS